MDKILENIILVCITGIEATQSIPQTRCFIYPTSIY